MRAADAVHVAELLARGERARTAEPTHANLHSSRGHALLRYYIPYFFKCHIFFRRHISWPTKNVHIPGAACFSDPAKMFFVTSLTVSGVTFREFII